MQISEIIDRCKHLKVLMDRGCSEDSAELVILSKDETQWSSVLAESLGPAIKPSGKKPSKEDDQLTKEFGGIMDSQTLFKKDFDQTTVIAMFWPWQDKKSTTLKVFLLNKEV